MVIYTLNTVGVGANEKDFIPSFSLFHFEHSKAYIDSTWSLVLIGLTSSK